MTVKKKTRGQLLAALRELQGLVGQISAVYENDRSPDRADRMRSLCTRAFSVAIDALSTDPPGVAAQGESTGGTPHG